MMEPTQAELEAFIRRAGHSWGWLNLESAARRMAERAVFEINVYRAERDQARARVDNAVRLLTGIHSLLYPAPVTLADGRTMVFRPKTENLDPHEVLQALSDRIRALPDELEKLRAQSTPQPADVRADQPLSES